MHYILFKRPTFILLGNILSEICPNFVSNFIFLPILYLSLFLTQLLSNFLNNHTISYEIISLSFIAKLLFLCTSRSSFQFHVSIFVLFQIILYYFILDYFIILQLWENCVKNMSQYNTIYLLAMCTDSLTLVLMSTIVQCANTKVDNGCHITTVMFVCL